MSENIIARSNKRNEQFLATTDVNLLRIGNHIILRPIVCEMQIIQFVVGPLPDVWESVVAVFVPGLDVARTLTAVGVVPRLTLLVGGSLSSLRSHNTRLQPPVERQAKHIRVPP